MGYLPGPLLLQTAGNVGISTSDYNFAGDVADQLSDLDTLPGSWEPLLAGIANLMAEPSDPFPDVDIDHSILTVNAYGDPATLLGTDALTTGLGDAELSFGTAIGFAPAEAWVNSSAPFVPPAAAETLGVPIIPPGAIGFQVTGTVSGSTTVPAPGLQPGAATVTLTNLSQYGSPNFREGDDFQVTATGGYGQIVYVYGVLNGVDIGGGPQGSIGADGKWVLTGTMEAQHVGVWQETWYVGAVQVATFSFIVVAN